MDPRSVTIAQTHSDRPLRLLQVIATVNRTSGGPIEGLLATARALSRAGFY